MKRVFLLPAGFLFFCLSGVSATTQAQTTSTPTPDREVACDILVAGAGLAGVATAYESLHAGKTVCLTDITDWLGGQISSQGTAALDERPTQRRRLFFPRGYLQLRQRIEQFYDRLNPGKCWVSESCFFPRDAHQILRQMLRDAEKRGEGTLHWFPNTVIKELKPNSSGNFLTGAIAIQHQSAADAPPLNTKPLSETITEAYRYQDSENFTKTMIRLHPPPAETENNDGPNWYVVDATETGELVALADVPYRLGIDPRSAWEPSASTRHGSRYCTQGFTYTFAMEATQEPPSHTKPDFYDRYQPYYSYELERLADFSLVFTYRRIHSAKPDKPLPSNIRDYPIHVGDISMQNWTWGNDYRPGTSGDNLIYTRKQLQAVGQLEPGGWMGGLRVETLAAAEELARGFFYWLVRGETDSQLGAGVKEPHPNYRYLQGYDSPMGTAHGLSKYPYIREARRIIGRSYPAYPEGFTVWEVDISRQNFQQDWYRLNLTPQEYERLWTEIAGVDKLQAIRSDGPQPSLQRSRSRIYPDAVGIAHYAIDFHPCMGMHPPEASGNFERPGERFGAGAAYPFQIPLRATIPQQFDNFLVAGKSIATSHVAAAAYRVHSFEWSVGAAVGNTVAFALQREILPVELVDDLPQREPMLEVLRQRLQKRGNPIAFPDTSIFNQDWQDWR